MMIIVDGRTVAGSTTPHVYDKYDNYDADGDVDASMIRRCLHVHVTFEESCLHNKTRCLRSISAH